MSGRLTGAGAIESLGYRAPRRSFIARASTTSGGSSGGSVGGDGDGKKNENKTKGEYSNLVDVDFENDDNVM